MKPEVLLNAFSQVGNKSISLGYNKIILLDNENFHRNQVGYRVDQEGKDLTGDDYGKWRYEWFVSAIDIPTSKPIFIDTTDQRIYHASMGRMGEWEPTKISDNPDDFISILKKIIDLSINRDTPQGLKRNPLTEIEVSGFQKYIESLKGCIDKEFWFRFIS